MVMEIADHYYKKSNTFGFFQTLFILTFVFGLLFLTSTFLNSGSYLWALISSLLLGAQIYKLTILLHDCAHYTLFDQRWLNTSFGYFIGGMLGADFFSFQREHLNHHKRCGTALDTAEGNFTLLENSNKYVFLWFVVKPLLGLSYIEVLINNKKQKTTKSKGMNYRFLSYLVLSQTLILFTGTLGFQYLWGLLVYPLCAATLGLFFSRIRGICEHVSLFKRGDGVCFVRTHSPNFFDSIFFYSTGMNYHLEHHNYPGVPSVRLPEIHSQYLKNQVFTQDNLSNSIFRTLFKIYSSRASQ